MREEDTSAMELLGADEVNKADRGEADKLVTDLHSSCPRLSGHCPGHSFISGPTLKLTRQLSEYKYGTFGYKFKYLTYFRYCTVFKQPYMKLKKFN